MPRERRAWAYAWATRNASLTASCKNTTFKFARYREPGEYRMNVERKGAIPPPEESGGTYAATVIRPASALASSFSS